jgi:hypothetical protein
MGFWDTIISMIPANPIEALATGNILQIIIFGLFLGFGISALAQEKRRKVVGGLNTILEACGCAHIPLISMCAGSCVKFISSYYLIGNVNFGIIGAPIGTILSYLVSMCISAAFLRKKTGYTPFGAYTFIMPLINSAITLFPIGFAFRKLFIEHYNPPALLFAVIVSVIVYIMFSLLTGIITPGRVSEIAKYTK